MSDEEDLTQTTYEQAKRCPKCGQSGDVRTIRLVPASAGLPRGTSVHTVYCVTELCKWYDTPWNIQVNADGSIPPPQNHTGTKKVYAGTEGHDEFAARFIAGLKHQLEQETQRKPDGTSYEIRN